MRLTDIGAKDPVLAGVGAEALVDAGGITAEETSVLHFGAGQRAG